ncbi:hypothetical protein K0U00_18865 [Paenibacillus sepulcri]|uniref:Acyltransferase 3 domain-containing protein n=1 Tax=Paenibacillus sepulcri TaxID=359917 RepID=A0ABS7C5B2_9BACL|nr:hypothetical protein [Paenibacillus sepulcri]
MYAAARRCLFGWGLAAAIAAVDRLLPGESAWFRMVSIIAALLYAMKTVVYVEYCISENRRLPLIRWIFFHRSTGGYGGPLLYFLIHGMVMMMMIEHALDRQGHPISGIPWLGRLWTLVWLVVPVKLLLPDAFLHSLIWPLAGICSSSC